MSIIADFVGSPTSMEMAGLVSFTDQSTSSAAILSWEWDFGDGSAHSSAENPTHEYVHSGVFTVVLTISDGRTTVSERKENYISIDRTPSTCPIGEKYRFWPEFSAGNLIGYGSAVDVYSDHLEIDFSIAGAVEGAARVDCVELSTSNLVGTKVIAKFNNVLIYNTGWQSNRQPMTGFGIGQSVSSSDNLRAGIFAGPSVNVGLGKYIWATDNDSSFYQIINDIDSGPHTMVLSLEVVSSSQVKFTVELNGAPPVEYVLNITIPTGYKKLFLYSDRKLAYHASGSSEVEYVYIVNNLQSGQDCIGEIAADFFVVPENLKGAQYNKLNLSEVKFYTLADNYVDIISWEWDFGDGSAHSSAENPTHEYAHSGVYFVKLTVSDGVNSSQIIKPYIVYYSGGDRLVTLPDENEAELDCLTIPFKNLYSFSEEVELDEKIVKLEFNWNSTGACWMMGVYNAFSEPIVVGVRLVLGFDLFSGYTHPDLPGGKLMVIDPAGGLDDIGVSDFVNRRGLKLVYLKESNF